MFKAAGTGWLNSSQQHPLDTLAIILIFAFPVFAISVRHWASAIFSFLVVLSLIRLPNIWKTLELTALERLLLLAMTLFFASYVLSSLVNGWDEGSWRILGKELRFLGFLPLYAYLRSLPNTEHAIGLGSIVGIPINFVLVSYELWWLNLSRGDVGVYGSLFSGPFTVLMLVAACAYLCGRPVSRLRTVTFWAVSVLAAGVAFQMSRSAILGFLIWGFLYSIWIARNLRILAGAVSVFLVTLFFLGQEIGAEKLPDFTKVFDECVDYFADDQASDSGARPLIETSVGTRLELLRASFHVFRDFPAFGVGGYNFQNVINDYVAQGLVSQSLQNANHPHNVFAEVLVSKGLFGFLVFFAVLLISARICWSGFLNTTGHIGHFGLIYLIVISAMMLTESAIAIKGNFISTFLLFLAVYCGSSVRIAKK